MAVPLQLTDLDAETRREMLAEFDLDVAAGTLFLSSRLSAYGREIYPELLHAAILEGDDSSLASSLGRLGVMAANETAVRRGVPYSKRIPHDAHQTLAEGEFNRFYLRGLCRVVLALGGHEVEVYRAKPTRTVRSQSRAVEGSRLDAARLLQDLRTSVGADTAMGLPPGPNSGLSARHPVTTTEL